MNNAQDMYKIPGMTETSSLIPVKAVRVCTASGT